MCVIVQAWVCEIACECACVRAWARVHAKLCMCISICVGVYLCECVCMCTRVCVCASVHACVSALWNARNSHYNRKRNIKKIWVQNYSKLKKINISNSVKCWESIGNILSILLWNFYKMHFKISVVMIVFFGSLKTS